MNKIQQKLRSRAGASMLMAMVFMLFCSFIGGTVLASATANAQRVAQMAEQQDFLLERSAALLATDQLQLDSGKYLRLTVVDQDRTLQAINMNPNGTYDPAPVAPIKDRVITFTVSSSTLCNTIIVVLNQSHCLVLAVRMLFIQSSNERLKGFVIKLKWKRLQEVFSVLVLDNPIQSHLHSYQARISLAIIIAGFVYMAIGGMNLGVEFSGGSNVQVPSEVTDERSQALALRWLVNYAKTRNGNGMAMNLANEIMDAANGVGGAVKKREDTHKMAEANKAFAHYRY